MKNLFVLLFSALSILALSSTSPADLPPYGALHIINLPAIADDLDITFTQPGATPINVLGSQLGHTPGASSVTISAADAAYHFSNNGFNAQNPVNIKIGLLDETGDTITDPGPVTGSFTMNPNGDTVVNYGSM